MTDRTDTPDQAQPEITERDLDRLDAVLAQARSAPPAPSADLLARVLADAQANQPAPATNPDMTSAVPQGRPSILRQIWRGLGGWPAFASLSTAAMAGLWLGVSPPAVVLDLTDGLGLSSASIALPEGAGLLDTYLGEG